VLFLEEILQIQSKPF